MASLTDPVPENSPTFLAAPRCLDLADLSADVAILGAPYGTPYGMKGSTSVCSGAPAAIRAQSQRWSTYLDHYDFDFGGRLFGDRKVSLVDCGDVTMTPGAYQANSQAIQQAVRAILERGGVPIVLGGDDSIPIPVMRAYDQVGSMAIVQFDAHLDWRDEIDGISEGLSSPMRRASELPFVNGMIQIGLRGVGMGRPEEFAAAQRYGSVLVGAEEVHRDGVEAVLAKMPDSENYFLTLDVDGLDPAIAPGVGYPAFGGLSYYQMFQLFRGIAARGKIVGFDVAELNPAYDLNGITSLLVVRLILNLLGCMAHQGQIGTPRSAG